MLEKVYILLGILALGLILYLSGDGFYRYPCQDPENWGKPECLPPLCKANMTCTDQVVRTQYVASEPE